MKKVKTDNIQIIVEPAYLSERSDPTKPIYMFSYKIKIKNTGTETVQLKSRYWHITDGNGNVEEIRGPGVVGNQPYLKNGERFEYTSFCPLPTEFGVMHGHFEMICENGKKFNAIIKPFRLTIPYSVN
ncbi:MAG: Co2+/Mg2+ efflux protein ApaG [Candidatus Marinimicrobia bacterium]|nr:Co2+/Mg2+ efflux protein ApaG [Candidatus Neomarinimicrobiota bacterium]|tara:strand:- start:2459 stop:2842 length:384 start_codon:yes stop_codon:yes gene_type:complete